MGDLTATRKSSSSSPVATARPRRDSSPILRPLPSRPLLPRPRPSETQPLLVPTPIPSSLPSPRRTKNTRSIATSELSVPSSTTRVAGTPEQRPRQTRRSEIFQEHWSCKPKDRSALQAAAARNYQPRNGPFTPCWGLFAEPLPRCNQLYRLFGKHSLIK